MPIETLRLALIEANPDRCAEALSRAPEQAHEMIQHSGFWSHPLTLLSQWPGRAPHINPDIHLPRRVFDCARILIEHGSDLSAASHSKTTLSCAGALLIRMAHQLRVDQTWGIAPCRDSLEGAIMRASLDESCPRRAASALAWIHAADKLRKATFNAESGFAHFIGLARALSEREALSQQASPPSASPISLRL